MKSQDMNSLAVYDLSLFRQGIEQFNRRQFFECHETWEQLWKGQTGKEKELIQGLIQLAVAYHHFLKGNNKGALKLFKRALPRLQVFHPHALGLELGELCSLIRANIEQLEANLNCPFETIVVAVLSTK